LKQSTIYDNVSNSLESKSKFLNSLENSALSFKTLIENERKELSQLNMIRRERQLESEIKLNEEGD